MAIDLAIEDGVATVTINRPEAKNAITIEMREQLWTVFEALAEDDQVRAVILTGAGDAFCAGMDVKEMGGGGIAWSVLLGRRWPQCKRRGRRVPDHGGAALQDGKAGVPSYRARRICAAMATRRRIGAIASGARAWVR